MVYDYSRRSCKLTATAIVLFVIVGIVVFVVPSASSFVITNDKSSCHPTGQSRHLQHVVKATNTETETNIVVTNNDNVITTSSSSSRRGFITSATATIATATATAAAAVSVMGTVVPAHAASSGYVLGKKDSVVGREIASFNDLIYNFKNTALNGGLDASTLNEPSVPFIEFGERMKKGEVAFVEFLAPSGQVAYVTFKKPGDKKLLSNKKNTAQVATEKPIRIGQGYPLGGKNSWSSPDYVIRSVVNFGVPYKFTVPALASAKYKKKSD